MSGRFVRSSKFRHVFGTPNKQDKCYDNLKISKSPHESNMSAVNSKFLAVVLESQGGGAFFVAPLSKVKLACGIEHQLCTRIGANTGTLSCVVKTCSLGGIINYLVEPSAGVDFAPDPLIRLGFALEGARMRLAN